MTSMDRTESTVRNLITAIEAPLYDVGVLSDRGMLPGLDSISAAAVLERLPLLKYRNARGSHIYIRPSGEHRSPRSTISARPRLRGYRPTASTHVLLSRQARQLSSLAQASENVSEAPRNLRRADIGPAVRR